MPGELEYEKKALDLSGEIPAVEGAESDEELFLTRDLVTTFVKTVKAFRFYPPENPTLKGFRDQLLKKFQFFLNKYNSLMLQIGEYEISYSGKVLYDNKDVKTSLAFFLYKDGLRELRFIKGLEEWEVEGLLDVVKRSDHLNQMEDDLVTLLWERDLVHISYLATDDVLEETAIPIPEDIGQFRKNLVFKPLAHAVEASSGEDDSEEEIDLNRILSRRPDEPPPVASNRGVYFLTPEEVEGLRKDVEVELDPTFVFSITDILFEILAIEKEPESYKDAVNVLNKILDGLLTLGDFQKAGELLKRIYIILKTYELKDWQAEAIRQIIVEAGEPPRIERLGKVLEKEEGLRLEEVGPFLILLQRNSIKPLIKLLGDLKNSKTRRVICDALAEIGKNAIDLIAPSIDDRRWFLVRNIAYVLGRIGKEQSLPYLQKVFSYEDVRVRREVIQALGLIGGPKVMGMLVKALSDPDVRIRGMAAINLGKVGKMGALVPLLEIIQSKDFPKKEPVEVKAFFDAVGMVGSNDAVDVLQQLLEKKSWFGRGKDVDLRTGAAGALAMIGTPEARAILESGKESKDSSIRSACVQALRGMTS
jgi:hypothetical protein